MVLLIFWTAKVKDGKKTKRVQKVFILNWITFFMSLCRVFKCLDSLVTSHVLIYSWKIRLEDVLDLWLISRLFDGGFFLLHLMHLLKYCTNSVVLRKIDYVIFSGINYKFSLIYYVINPLVFCLLFVFVFCHNNLIYCIIN